MIQVIRSAENAGLNNPWIVLDNVPRHVGVEEALDKENNQNPLPHYRVARLPPYSCELNPIECMFNVIKSKAKQELAELNVPRNSDETLIAFRFRKMCEVITSSLPTVTQQKLTQAFQHCIAKVIP